MTLFTSRPDLQAWPPLGYVHSRLDRAAHLRPQAAELLLRPDAGIYACGGEMVALHPSAIAGIPADPVFTRAETDGWCGDEAIFLGMEGAAPRFARAFDPGRRAEIEAAGFEVTDLRTLASGALVRIDHLGPLATGKALFAWHERHRFCANCGAPAHIADAGWRRECPSCGAHHFPRTDPVVIMAVTRGTRCLLCHLPRFAPNMWSCLAGFVEPGETIEDAVRRETCEEAGIVVGRVAYRASQPWPFPMQLMFGCLAEARSETITIDPTELEAARWFEADEVAAMLAGTHPDSLFLPPPPAIAHHLIRAFVEGAHA